MNYNDFIECLNMGHEFRGYIDKKEFNIIHHKSHIWLVFDEKLTYWSEKRIVHQGLTLKELFEKDLIELEEMF